MNSSLFRVILAVFMSACSSGKTVPKDHEFARSPEKSDLSREALIDRVLGAYFFVNRKIYEYQITLTAEPYLSHNFDRHQSGALGEINKTSIDIEALLEGIYDAETGAFNARRNFLELENFKYKLHSGVTKLEAYLKDQSLRIELSSSDKDRLPNYLVKFVLGAGCTERFRIIGSRKTEQITSIENQKIYFRETSEGGVEIARATLERLEESKSTLSIKETHSHEQGRTVDIFWEFNPFHPFILFGPDL